MTRKKRVHYLNGGQLEIAENSIAEVLKRITPNYLRLECGQGGGVLAEIMAENGRKVLNSEYGASLERALVRVLLSYEWSKAQRQQLAENTEVSK